MERNGELTRFSQLISNDKIDHWPQRIVSNVDPPADLQGSKSCSKISREDEMLKVMQKQNAITELLAMQQKQSQLPTKNIPVFRGDALQYKSFIRAFEHSIEQKTDNEQDKLYFLEQFTNGEPQELVRSCIHMPPNRGYKEAKSCFKGITEMSCASLVRIWTRLCKGHRSSRKMPKG